MFFLLLILSLAAEKQKQTLNRAISQDYKSNIKLKWL